MPYTLTIGDDNELAFSTDGKATLRWDSQAQRLKFKYDGQDKASLDVHGVLRIAMTFAARQTQV